MSYPLQHYTAIDNFFDTYSLPDAQNMLGRLIKTAQKEKTWKGPYPAETLFLTEKLQGLTAAVFDLLEDSNRPLEIILSKQGSKDIWMLTQYQHYCGWQVAHKPWHFFPRHLSQKEFLNPFIALEKFTRYRSLSQWKLVLKDLSYYALSPCCMNHFDDGSSLIGAWLHLHKLLDATHLIEVRRKTDKGKTPKKWKAVKKIKQGR